MVNSTLAAAIGAFGEAPALGEVLGLDRPVLPDALADTSPRRRVSHNAAALLDTRTGGGRRWPAD